MTLGPSFDNSTRACTTAVRTFSSESWRFLTSALMISSLFQIPSSVLLTCAPHRRTDTLTILRHFDQGMYTGSSYVFICILELLDDCRDYDLILLHFPCCVMSMCTSSLQTPLLYFTSFPRASTLSCRTRQWSWSTFLAISLII